MKIKDVKKKIRHEKWREEISECQSSGLKVKEWCENKGLNTNTYYNRLRVIREKILARSESEVQEIVPVSISSEISVSDTENTSSPTARDSDRDKAIIRMADAGFVDRPAQSDKEDKRKNRYLLKNQRKNIALFLANEEDMLYNAQCKF